MNLDLESIFDRLWPLNRSLTGNGNRETLRILSEYIPLNISEIPCGTKCFDWEIPPEWNVKDAWIKDASGRKIVDFCKNNLCLLGYSEPVHKKVSWEELKQHLYTLPNQPQAIPYRTSYYQKRWGFCISYSQYLSLSNEEEYEVYIDASYNPLGSMTIAESEIKGRSDKTIYITSYICHPSMANNELSGPLVICELYHLIKLNIVDPYYTYKFLLMPETIGSIWYLSVHRDEILNKCISGVVVTCIGDNAPFTLKKSRRGNGLLEQSIEYLLRTTCDSYKKYDFFPLGSDERQYCSPGFDLPFCSLTRSMYGEYDEYHTSLDNKEFISFDAMSKSAEFLMQAMQIVEYNGSYMNLYPYCELQLGKRGLYPTLSAPNSRSTLVDAFMWILNYSDGNHDLMWISEKSGINFFVIKEAVEILLNHKILIRK